MNSGTDIQEAVARLKAGDLVAIPTETVYGLAANALNPDAVLGIFKAKNRPAFNPLIIHVASMERAWEYVTDVPAAALKLAAAYWPGPLTLLLPKRVIVPDLVTAGSPLVAVRVPAHPLTRAVLEQLDFPVAAPSANPFGYISPTDAIHVQQQLGDKVSYILDGGTADVGVESTIIGFTAAGEPVLRRQGGLSQEAIESLIGPVQFLTHSESPESPGMLKSHYSPRTPLLMGNIPQLIQKYAKKRIGVLAFQTSPAEFTGSHEIILSPAGDLGEAAKNLFAALYALDAMGLDLILAEKVPHTGLGRAINDRLERAQSIHK